MLSTKYVVLLFMLLIASQLKGQTTIYAEDFSGQLGKGIEGPGNFNPVTNLNGVSWGFGNITECTPKAGGGQDDGYTNADDYCKVVNDNGNLRIEAQDVNSTTEWLSPVFSIANYENMVFSFYAKSRGSMENSGGCNSVDFLDVYYQIDGGAWQVANQYTGEISDGVYTTNLTGTGSTMRIKIEVMNWAGNESYFFDDVTVKGTLVALPPQITINQLTPTTICPISNDSVVIDFELTDANLQPGNKFTVEVSDPNGSFANAVTLAPAYTAHITNFYALKVGVGSLQPGTKYAFRVRASNPALTSNNTVTNVTVGLPNANVAYDGNFNLCQGDSLVAFNHQTATQQNVQWFRGGQPIAGTIGTNPALTINQQGNYMLVATQNNCADTTRLPAINMVPRPQAPTLTDTNVCPNGMATFVAGPPSDTNYYWYSPATGNLPTDSGATYQPTTPTQGHTDTIIVNARYQNCWATNPDTATVSTIDVKQIDVALTYQISVFDSVPIDLPAYDTIIITPNTNVAFLDANTAQLGPGLQPGAHNYGIEAQYFGCPVYASMQIDVTGELEIFNVFSPNDDGYNDKWVIKNIELYPNNNVKIYNRWGFLIYQANNYNNTTNVFAGFDQTGGTYFYAIDLGTNRITGAGGGLKKGTLSILKN